MSMTFKITVPEGELCEHLKDRDSRSRNFEIIRLATNDLLRGNSPTQVISVPIENSKVDIDEKTTAADNIKRRKDDVQAVEESIENEESINDSDEIVDLGDDILQM